MKIKKKKNSYTYPRPYLCFFSRCNKKLNFFDLSEILYFISDLLLNRNIFLLIIELQDITNRTANVENVCNYFIVDRLKLKHKLSYQHKPTEAYTCTCISNK